MNTELAITPAPGTVSKTGIILSNMDEIWRFSETVINSGLAPKGISNPSAATIIIQMGMELGLPPMASLQNIAAINGRPSIWGDAMLGVVRATGELEEFTEWFENNGVKLARTPSEFPDTVTAICRVKRRGYDAIESSFSVADAKRAKLWGKQGPWTEYTARMLKFRARSFGLRDEFGDALRGLYSAEEQRDMPNEMREAVGHVVEPTTTKVITGGTATPEPTIEKPAPAKASKGKAAPAKAQQAEAQPIPERGVMVDAIRTAFTEAGLFASGAQKVCRDAKLLDENVAFSDISDEQMAQVYHRRLELFPPLPIIAAFYDRHTVTKSPEGAERKWTRWSVIYQVAGEKGEREASTFSATFGGILDSLQGGEALLLRVAAGEKGGQITHLELPTEGGTEA